MSKKIILMSMLFSMSGMVMAQTGGGAVGGQVLDENGDPLVGAQVKIKGTKTGTVTDINGNFSLPAAKRGDVLVINYLGMNEESKKAASGMKITMAPDNRQLDEVIVVAYGEQKKSSFTGSAGVVDADKLAIRPVNNVANALEGQVAGVQSFTSSGDPNATPTFLIRGISSINAGVTPLIVVDGAPFSGSWNDINPADVAQITVLKDAASNALYGARGANGVIMITTKSPEKGRVKVTLDAKWGSTSRASRDYDMIDNPGEYYEAYYGALYRKYISDGMTPSAAHAQANTVIGSNDSSVGGLGYIVYSVPDGQYLIGDNGKLNPNARLGNVVSYNGQDYMLYPDDWLDNAMRHTLRQEYNFNVNGGNDVSQVYASVGYLKEPGIAYGSGIERYTARLKASVKANEWLKAGANVNFAHTISNYNSSSSGYNVFFAANNVAPIYPLFIRDGQGNIMTDRNGKMYDYGNGDNGGRQRQVEENTNALQEDLLQTDNSRINSFSLNGYVDITPKFLDGLKITLNGTVSDYEYRTTTTSQPFYGWSKASYPEGYVSKGHYRTYSVNLQQLVNYARSFGKHNMTLLFGHESYKTTDEDVTAAKSHMFSYFDNQELSGAIKDEEGSSDQSKYNTEGWFFRGMYDYDSKYFGQVSYRRDGSSHFAPGHRWGNFYSFGGAWMLSKEPFMASTKDWIDELKIKASFGQQGNDAIGNNRYRNTYSIVNSNGNVGIEAGDLGNVDVTWETNTNVNAGVEFALFKSRLSGSVEYFYRRTTNMLSYIYLPQSYGYAGYYDNVGNMKNSGIEINLAGDVIRTKKLTWSLNLNATHYRNKITKIYDENKELNIDGHGGYMSGDYYYGEGLPIYTWYLHKYAGVNENGESLWYHNNSDGTISTTTSHTDASYYLCGDPTPDLYGGFGTTLTYAGFDFGVTFSYSLGGKVLDSGYANLMASPSTSLLGFNFHKDVLKAWSPTNATSNIPRFQYGDDYSNLTSDRFLINGNWLSLQNITLGYTVPRNIVSKLGLTKLRVYATAENVAFWSKRKGLDPRGDYGGAPGTENYSQTRVIEGGITLEF